MIHPVPRKKRLLNIADTAFYLSLSQSSIRNLIRAGAIATVRAKPTSGRILIDVEELNKWARRCTRRVARLLEGDAR